ncbi:MAG: hypothetical protein IPH28_24070 [Cytophagaceae bacterium]|jgi:hypothetical protein|nr:hypothetical protein [Cytophagaceae bacterium]MBK9508019.1 hypothetical protein [Cytophagaceae bacterium]MBK9936427.1 hypothetical protein [Cytophagaceae bacterium]MBL0300177.1 hypothetical protein [Cytophagaceae bacterium]MBL0327113.1 hypothetical protein [Cytophagaceae bacterium]
MNKRLKITGSVALTILGWLMGGIAYTVRLPFGLNTLFFILGVILMPAGFILLIIILKK